jgi:hypothetical protein
MAGTLILSTGCRNGLAQGKGIKEMFEDAVLYGYDGSVPATADVAPTGNLLFKLTKDGAALTASTVSTRQEANVTCVKGSTNDTVTLICSTPSKTLVYTQVAGDSTNDILATSLATAINADATLSPVMEAIAIIGAGVTEAVLYLRARYAGEPFVITSITGSGGITTTLNDITANARINSLHLGTATLGYVEKETAYDWEGVGLIAGTCSYARFVHNNDLGTNNATDPRLQMNVATSGAALNLAGSTGIVVGGPVLVSSFKLNIKYLVS